MTHTLQSLQVTPVAPVPPFVPDLPKTMKNSREIRRRENTNEMDNQIGKYVLELPLFVKLCLFGPDIYFNLI